MILPAKEQDLGSILALQKKAFQREADRYTEITILPMVQTLEQLRREFGEKVFLKAVWNGKLVGSVRVGHEGGTGLLGRLMVEPDMQGKGIGTQLLAAAEAAIPGLCRWELFTGNRSEGNLRLYQRNGYKPIREELISGTVSVIYLEKVRC